MTKFFSTYFGFTSLNSNWKTDIRDSSSLNISSFPSKDPFVTSVGMYRNFFLLCEIGNDILQREREKFLERLVCRYQAGVGWLCGLRDWQEISMSAGPSVSAGQGRHQHVTRHELSQLTHPPAPLRPLSPPVEGGRRG